jgi:predicted transcriptional regulator
MKGVHPKVFIFFGKKRTMSNIPDLEEIKKLRKGMRMTQSELASMAGVSQAYVAKLESGKVDPKLSTLEKILTVLRQKEASELKSGDVMVTPVITINPFERLSNAIFLMGKYGISQLVVVRQEKIVGSLSEKSLIRKIDLSEVKKYKDKNVYEFMDDPFPQVTRDESLSSVLELLKNNSAVIVSERGKPAGIITRSDVLGMLKV